MDHAVTHEATPSEAVKKPALFPFDQELIDIRINVTPGADRPFYTTHRVRRPTLEELNNRESMTVYEMRDLGGNEEEVVINDDTGNSYVYDLIAREVQGYDLGDGVDPQEFRPVNEGFLNLLSVPHKNAVLRGLYFSQAKIEVDPQMTGFRLGGVREMRVRQSLGQGDPAPFSIVHILREPSEPERAAYRERASQTRNVRGSRRARSKIVTNLSAAVELYDTLLLKIEGAQVAGEEFTSANRGAYLRAIDPMYKRQVIVTLISSLEADLQV